MPTFDPDMAKIVAAEKREEVSIVIADFWGDARINAQVAEDERHWGVADELIDPGHLLGCPDCCQGHGPSI